MGVNGSMENVHTMLAMRLDSNAIVALLKARDWDSLRSSTQTLVQTMGVDDFLVRLDRRICAATSGSRLFGSMPSHMLAEFDGQMQSQGNFVCRHVSRSRLPLEWKLAEISACAYDDAYNVLGEYGVVQGVSVGVRGEDTLSRVDFYRSAQAQAFSATQLADLMLLASYLHEAGQTLWHQQDGDSLSRPAAREYACAD